MSISIPKKLLIFYGWPGLFNNSNGNISNAATEFGRYDFDVTRERQNEAVGIVHDRGKPVMVNAWEPDDVFGATAVPIRFKNGS